MESVAERTSDNRARAAARQIAKRAKKSGHPEDSKTKSRDYQCGDDATHRSHPERSAGGKAGEAQLRDPVEPLGTLIEMPTAQIPGTWYSTIYKIRH